MATITPEPAQADSAAEIAGLRAALGEATALADATARVLRLLGDAAGDPRAVLDHVAEQAARVCEAEDALIYRLEGDFVRRVAHYGSLAKATGPIGDGFKLGTDSFTARVIRSREPVHIPDLGALLHEEGAPRLYERGFRTFLIAPLLSRGELLGHIFLRRMQVVPFTDAQIAALGTFASQGVIAIEQARLFSELQASNTALQETLEQQTATADVLRAIASSPSDLPRVLASIAEALARLISADDCQVFFHQDGGGARRATFQMYGYRPADGALRHLTWEGVDTRRDWAAGRAVVDRDLVEVSDLTALEEDEGGRTFGGYAANWVRARVGRGNRAVLGVPLLREGVALGAIVLHRNRPGAFPARDVAVARTFADQAVIAIQNARLFAELQESNRTLTEKTLQLGEAIEQQTATQEALRVVAGNPTDLHKVLDAIAQSALRLCGPRAHICGIFRLQDGALHTLALQWAPGVDLPEGAEDPRSLPPRPLERGWAAAHAVWERRQIHLEDAREAGAEYPISAEHARRGLQRTLLVTPLLRDGEPVGVLSTGRGEVEPFTEREMRLMQTFADQAVIALENGRLFQELNESNATLKEALEQQTATAEVLREMGRSAFDLRPLLDRLGEHVHRLTGAQNAQIWRLDGGRLRLTALHGATPAMHEYLRDAAYAPEELARAAPGRAALDRRLIRIDDVLAEPPGRWVEADEYFQQMSPIRSLVAIPLLRGDSLTGVLTFWRERPEPFTDAQVALAQMFADQAAIAIENARLFEELRERDERRRQELERASAIQQRLLPSTVEGWPGVLEVAVRFRPAVETSGDFFDVLPLAPARAGDLPPLQVAVGDVAGKGMSAALVTALARSALQLSATVPTGMATPATTLRIAGQRLHRDVGSGHFVACALAVVEPPGRHHDGPRLKLANAAQVPVLLVRSGATQELEPPGYRLPLGAQDDGDYRDTEADLRPGDVVVFSSDGLVEAPARAYVVPGEHLAPPAKAGELFGFERLQRSAAHWAARADSAEAVAEGIWADLTAWCGEESHHDDVTLLVLRVPPC